MDLRYIDDTNSEHTSNSNATTPEGFTDEKVSRLVGQKSKEKSGNNSAVKHINVKNVTLNNLKSVDSSRPSDRPLSNRQNSAGAKNHSNMMEESDQDKKKLNDDEKLENGFEDAIMDDVDIGKNENAVDQTDAASVFSLYMESTPRYYFQHPWCRVGIAYIVTICNFFIYAEDPVAHSVKEANVPVIGHDFAFVFTRYPLNAWSLLKVFLWLAAIIVGLLVGKLLCHHLMFNRLFKLKMFSSDQGSWMTMFLTSVVLVFIFALLYNAFLLIGGASTEPYRISALMGVSNSIFMKGAACGTWCGDFFTAWMVTDMMLQEKLYPNWAKPVKTWWNRRYNRIILFWIIVLVTSFIVIFVIATNYIDWDSLNRGLLPSNEVSRSFLASFILVMDIMIVMQDWDFPHFLSSFDIKLPGINASHINFSIPVPKCLLKEYWKIHITGKWFNYGILFIVIILDMNMWKNQIFYDPFSYGQYAGPEGKIYTVHDPAILISHNETFLSFDYRNSTINPATNLTYIHDDTHMNARYYSSSFSIKAIAFIPSLCAFVTLGILVWRFGRFKPTKEDPYAGRLKKRKKKRFSFLMRKKKFYLDQPTEET